jgi:hypothetical protein
MGVRKNPATLRQLVLTHIRWRGGMTEFGEKRERERESLRWGGFCLLTIPVLPRSHFSIFFLQGK